MARSEDRAIANALSDLKTFTQINRLLEDSEGKDSLRRIAAKMGVSPTSIVECLKRLNQRYEVKLAETNEAIKSVHITEAGKAMIEGVDRIFSDFSELERRIDHPEASSKFTARVGISPYLLSTVAPAAVTECVGALEARGGAKIITEEAYETHEFIERITRQELDFALVWDYQGRQGLIKRTRGLDCAFSEKTFDALVVFGKKHQFRKKIDSSDPYVYVDELGSQQLYVLHEGHRFLDSELPAPNPMQGGGRIESYSIASMLGSIRAGMHGVAIVPSLYRDLDRFRRDGSVWFLPLKDRATNKKIPINVIYVFSSKYEKSADVTSNIGEYLKDRNRVRMRDGAIELIVFLEQTLTDQPKESGWQVENWADQRVANHKQRLTRAIESISDFKHSYHISCDNIGMERPSWHYATAKFRNPNQDDVNDSKLEGTLVAHRPGADDVVYDVAGELVCERIISLRGIEAGEVRLRNDRDCFVASLNFVDEHASVLIGVWSGRDRSFSSPMAGPIVFSKSKLAPGKLRDFVHIAMVRQLTSVTGSVNARFDEIGKQKRG